MTDEKIAQEGLESLKQLMQLIKTLRSDEKGCAWTRAQTFESLARYTLEESYEIIEAIQKSDPTALCHELGDMLYHIIFYAQIAEELNLFKFSDLAQSMLRKHAERRLDSNTTLNTPEAVNAIWQAQKQKLRREKNPEESLLDDVPTAMPALMRALKLQQRAAEIGFDWKNRETIFEKIVEEENELKEAISESQEKALEELGDVFFSYVNLARHLNLDPELAVIQANKKFLSRFQWMEMQAKKMGKMLDMFSLNEMENLWQQAKDNE